MGFKCIRNEKNYTNLHMFRLLSISINVMRADGIINIPSVYKKITPCGTIRFCKTFQPLEIYKKTACRTI